MEFLKKIFGKKQDSFIKEGVMIKLAFTVGGIDFYEVENIYTLPTHRGVKAVHVYRELKMGCDDEFLKAHILANKNIYNGKKIGFEEIAKLKRLNDILDERVNKIIDTDIVYKLAAIAFFTKAESPLEYDEQRAQKNIAHWKKHASVRAFFLQEPLIRLVPSLGLPDVNFQTYSEAIREFNKIHWDTLWSLLTEKQREIFKSSYESYAEVIQAASEN